MPDAQAFREVMGRFPTGVTVVTARDADGAPVGLTVNAFTSVSLEPPLVLVCLARDSASHDRVLAAGRFAVNVLTEAQGGVAWRFASEPSAGRFDLVPWREGPGGAPVLDGVAAWLACAVTDAHPAGDHSIIVGRVDAAEVGTAEALVFYRGALGGVAR